MAEPEQQRTKVMVVDDSKTVRRSAQSMLGKKGYSVVTANDGYEALSLVVRENPDIIFIDIMMPRLDGYQTCALIKNNSRYSGIPIVLLSSKDSIFDKARGRIVGSQSYLTKPFSSDSDSTLTSNSSDCLRPPTPRMESLPLVFVAPMALK